MSNNLATFLTKTIQSLPTINNAG